MIESAEQELGLTFTGSYRDFLQKYGAVVGKGLDIAGLVEPAQPGDPPYWCDAVGITLRQRKASRGLLPRHYVYVAGDGCDVTYYLATSPDDQEPPVLALGPGVDDVVVAKSFAEFVLRFSQSPRLYD